jgi:signal transduction histidine kinase
LLLGLVIVAAYVAVSRQIARPLRRLADTADRVAHQDLTAGFDPWPARDEVGNLTRSLEAMLVNIRERTLALERKTRELESFTYTVAHDLKTPLREIEGFSSLLERKVTDTMDPTACHYVSGIRTSALRLTALIEDLLHYSRLEQQALPTTAVNLRDLIEQVIAERVSTLEGARPHITIDLPYTEVRGEPTSIRQVLVNLMDNAIKFSRGSDPSEITIGGAATQTERILWIRDNGIGIDPEQAHKIFGLFERLHGPEDYEGTGVGLAIVKLVMDKHGGRVWVESAPGKGTTFYLAFPHGAPA